MVNFLDDLRQEATYRTNLFNDPYPASIVSRIDNLGKNARKMLEIGLVQDELLNLGFKPNYIRKNDGDVNLIQGYHLTLKGRSPWFVEVDFYAEFVSLRYPAGEKVLYKEKGWGLIVIEKVKKIII